MDMMADGSLNTGSQNSPPEVMAAPTRGSARPPAPPPAAAIAATAAGPSELVADNEPCRLGPRPGPPAPPEKEPLGE